MKKILSKSRTRTRLNVWMAMLMGGYPLVIGHSM
jgi:hypothetical protein